MSQNTGQQTPGQFSGEPIIRVADLRKRYGSTVAVDSVDLSVAAGEIFGILGPNGAGKTTLLEMIEGLREPDDGSITVAGLDVIRNPDEVKRRIGIQLQSTALFEHLTVRELISLFASLYGADASRERVDQLLQLVALEEKGDDDANELSGGQQQRLSITLALVNDPEIVFLDEPTTGLDPQARRNLWDVIRWVRDEGKTVVLTTHYMEEAEILCDRIAVMDHGQIILCDTPDQLIDTIDVRGAISVEFGEYAPTDQELATLAGAAEVQRHNGVAVIGTSDVQSTMGALLELSRQRGLRLDNLRTSRPTLEDVFLHYTGRALRE